MRGAGRSERGNGYGSTSCSTPACGVAMPCGSVVSMSAMASRPSRRRKAGTVEVTLPILPVLAETLEAGPCGDLTFIAGENGHPLTKESFGNLFRKACRAAGLRRSAHGLRKAAATTRSQ